jgi:FkbM family methyltransferase
MKGKSMTRAYFGIRNSVLRRAALKVFWYVNPGDITVKHHWTGDKLRLHSFKHKGYWWHGRKREQETILRFQKMIAPGGTVIEVGGHIGYFSSIYSKIIGDNGRLFVFEPGENNLPYIRRNLAPLGNTQIIEKAVSDEDGVVTFWLEELSGQNNSIIENYHLLEGNIELSGLGTAVAKHAVQVPCTTLDTFNAGLKAQGKSVDFIKIDVEGAELLVLQGSKKLLAEGKVALMVEVTREAQSIFDLMTGLGYSLSFADGTPVASPEGMEGNVFCIPGVKQGAA